MTNNNPLLEINNYGQSVWMDNLSRSLIESGELEKQIENYGLRGITSNPAIFEKAMQRGLGGFPAARTRRSSSSTTGGHSPTQQLSQEARLRQIQGKVAIANAKLAYQKFKEIIDIELYFLHSQSSE